MLGEEILLPNACRCCLLEDKDMVYVFDVLDEFEMQISDLIVRNGAVTIMENDCFSKHICGNCLNDLAIAERFVRRCQKTQNLLLELSKTEPESTESSEEKMFIVLNPDSLYVEPNSPTGEIEEDCENIMLTADTKHTKELEALFCDSKVEGEFEVGEENKTDQLEVIVSEDMLMDEDGFIEAEAIAIDDAVYHNLLQDTQRRSSVERIEDCPAEMIQFEEHFSDNDTVSIVESEYKCSGKVKNDFKHSCSNCGASFVTTKNYARHLKIHKILACHGCLRQFTSEKELDFHQLKCVKSESELESNAAEPTLIQNDQEIASNSKNPTSPSLSRRKPFECSYCSKRWVSMSALMAHRRTHTGERPFHCTHCPKRFKTTGGLDLHERRHTGSKPYSCSDCGKGFAESSNLKVHMMQHTNEKPHVCTVCNRAFARVYLLQLHQRTHTGEKPFGCEVCGKGFSQQSDLAAHRRIHSGVRPYVCSVCGKGFIKSAALTQHKKSHEKHLLIGDMDDSEGSSLRMTEQDEFESS
ncbi:zinc finger protein 431-like [Anopheles ziemanni]|uniref:zinc finger protein 431-like n=1 Tax=Anopheles coustani TaxID=139045 RepID=UPI00265846D0|nr:zinc finger protein 431-like [Anopheles coustani]XP_058174704.1 zinc finger protein 431-like [Anopheles ziemanni]